MIDFSTYHGISENELNHILAGIKNVRAAVIGDLSLDIYWSADMRRSELSRETPHFPLPVVNESMSPGAGGNVAVNIKALETRSVDAISIIGDDWRGDLLLKELDSYNINTKEIIRCRGKITNAYCKPIRKGISDIEYEDPRIDFTNYIPVSKDLELRLLERINKTAEKADVICICDQMIFGCVTEDIRKRFSVLAENGTICVADSRYRISEFKGIYLKPNRSEALKAVDMDETSDHSIGELTNAVLMLSIKNEAYVCMTLGSMGCLCSDAKTIVHIPSYKVEGIVDTCGAGDTFLSAFSCALAVGADFVKAAAFANLAADVAIKKIKTTGTASPEEIRLRHREILSVGKKRG